MKLNLGCGQDIRPDYLNIDIKGHSTSNTEIFKTGCVESIDWICENETVEEILAMDILAYIPPHELNNTIKNWVDKLEPGGIIKISIIDLFAISEAFIRGQASIDEFLILLFGKVDDQRLSSMDSQMLLSLIEKHTLKIETKRFDGIIFYIEAKK
jgi:hypothetical protein